MKRFDIIRRLARKQTSALGRALQKTRAPDIAEAIVYSAPYEQRFIWQASSDDELASEGLGIHSRKRPRRFLAPRADRTVDSTSQSHRSR